MGLRRGVAFLMGKQGSSVEISQLGELKSSQMKPILEFTETNLV